MDVVSTAGIKIRAHWGPSEILGMILSVSALPPALQNKD